MSANNNREGVDKALGMTEDQAIDEAWAKGHRQGLVEGRAMMRIELEHEAATTPRTPSATPSDINTLWAVIDELKARIDALEGAPRLYTVLPVGGASANFQDMPMPGAFGPGGRGAYEPQSGATLRGSAKTLEDGTVVRQNTEPS